MVVASRLTLKTYLCLVYFRDHPWIKEASAEQYLVTLRLLDSWAGRAVKVDELSAELILNFLRFRRLTRSPRTVNNNRAHLLTLFRSAVHTGHHPGPVPDHVPKIRETSQLPTAWSVEEFSRLLDACDSARCLLGWDGRHWRALLLVSWDTSHRLSALLSAKRDDLSALGFLIIRGEHTKQGRDVCHKLHADTIAALDALPEHEFMFPWPYNKRAIWLEYKKLLRVAGLPCGRRDLFHRLRRTSATHLAAVAGIEAAEKHLDHTTHGLAVRSYIDQRFMPVVQAADIMPRP